MKKRYIVFLLIFLLLSMTTLVPNCSIQYMDWQNVSISDVGTFKVPGDWFVTKKDYIIYITDKPIENEDHKVYLTGSIWPGKKDNDYDEVLYKLFGNVDYIEPTSGAIFSNNASYTLNEYIINENKEKKYHIRLSNFEYGIVFIVWDNSIDEDTVKKIAISYDRAERRRVTDTIFKRNN